MHRLLKIGGEENTAATLPAPQPWLTRWSHLRHHPWHGYVAALTLFFIALVARFAMTGGLPPGFPFLTFFPAILIGTFLGGRGPGLLCSALSVLSAWYFFIPPTFSFGLDNASKVAVVFFAAIAAVDVFVIDAVVRKQEAFEAANRSTQRLLDQQRVLFHELQHRVANNMAMVAAVLSAHQRRLADNVEAVQALADAKARFEIMSRIHRRLHDPALTRDDFESALRQLCSEAAHNGDAPIACTVQVDAAPLNLEQRVTVALLVVELITNAAKHAFTATQAGRIDVRIAADAGGSRLSVTDNGQGLPADFDAARSDRLGMRIVNGLVKSMNGLLTLRSGAEGTCFDVHIPGPGGQPPAPPSPRSA